MCVFVCVSIREYVRQCVIHPHDNGLGVARTLYYTMGSTYNTRGPKPWAQYDGLNTAQYNTISPPSQSGATPPYGGHTPVMGGVYPISGYITTWYINIYTYTHTYICIYIYIILIFVTVH